MKKNKGATYKDSGVDIDAGNRAVEMIKEEVAKTFPLIRYGKVITKLGSFGAVIELSNGMIIAATTDGVGTKLIVSMFMDKHDTVGIDLGAMCYNDLIAIGISPLFFLDYIAQGKQIPSRTVQFISGIIDGCHQAKSPLIGGEMAECPGLYRPEEYDFAGFAVGIAQSRKDLILGDDVAVGMNIYGLPSSGLHSNGYSLVRKVFGIEAESPVASIKRLKEYYGELECTLGEELLKPTVIYVDVVEKLMKQYSIAGMVNVTGGGFIDNPERVLPKKCAARFDIGSWKVHPIFKMIQERGDVKLKEMLRSTNYGIGFMIISPDKINEKGVVKIGEIVKRKKKAVIFKK